MATNACEISAAGADLSSSGCSPNDDDQVICGDITCDRMTQYCAIAMNDVIGDGQPEWFASCKSVACDEPGPPSCACVTADEQAHCHDTTGYPMVITPGGEPSEEHIMKRLLALVLVCALTSACGGDEPDQELTVCKQSPRATGLNVSRPTSVTRDRLLQSSVLEPFSARKTGSLGPHHDES